MTCVCVCVCVCTHVLAGGCSAGIGRTGAFIAIDTGLQEIDANGSCDVLRIVSSMREDRGGMVQNQVQYLFVYEVSMLPVSRVYQVCNRYPLDYSTRSASVTNDTSLLLWVFVIAARYSTTMLS